MTSGSYTLIETAKLYGVDPQAWLADTLARIDAHKITKLDQLLPWRYSKNSVKQGYMSCGRAVTLNGRATNHGSAIALGSSKTVAKVPVAPMAITVNKISKLHSA
ncbi:MAG: transposase domain-containing protein [Rhodospirillaceae bacterium]|nr:transposase domain-containing protein [Rhodospirillaceae bacterium]